MPPGHPFRPLVVTAWFAGRSSIRGAEGGTRTPRHGGRHHLPPHRPASRDLLAARSPLPAGKAGQKGLLLVWR